MRFHFLVSAALLAAALPLQAQAQSGRACMIASPIQTLGAPTLITDCLQGRKGTSRSAIKDRCEGADAVCRGAYEGEFDTWHYGRNEGQLASLAEECEADGGQWEEFE